MDKSAFIIGIIGLILFFISLIIVISATVNVIKRKTKTRNFLVSFIIFLIILGFASSSIFLALFLQTFSRYTHEERIGWLHAEEQNNEMTIFFVDEKTNSVHGFKLPGDQWMIEGCFLRWGLPLRWLGVGAYYRVTRFTGRWKEQQGKKISVYQVYPEEKLWEFLLKYGNKIPFVDAAYGIAAFQYPMRDTVYIYINDTGFILRTH